MISHDRLPRVKAAYKLMADAQRIGMGELMIRVLARHYKLKLAPRPSRPSGRPATGRSMNIAVPVSLWVAIHQDTGDPSFRPKTKTEAVMEILEDYLQRQTRKEAA